jgi:hypothetical protein
MMTVRFVEFLELIVGAVLIFHHLAGMPFINTQTRNGRFTRRFGSVFDLFIDFVPAVNGRNTLPKLCQLLFYLKHALSYSTLRFAVYLPV